MKELAMHADNIHTHPAAMFIDGIRYNSYNHHLEERMMHRFSKASGDSALAEYCATTQF